MVVIKLEEFFSLASNQLGFFHFLFFFHQNLFIDLTMSIDFHVYNMEELKLNMSFTDTEKKVQHSISN